MPSVTPHLKMDVVSLAQSLIQFPSVTPAESDIFDFLEHYLVQAGFKTSRMSFEEKSTEKVENLFARFGKGAPHFCFAGHVDVVPEGALEGWHYPPFAATLKDGNLYGRGASDMKGSVAAFLYSAVNFLSATPSFTGSISLLITGDEEGPALNGTCKVLDWMKQHDHIPDFCLLGEPTSVEKVGDMIKIGRRGSINFKLHIEGKAGHVAYPYLAHNPIPALVEVIQQLTAEALDVGNESFPPSHLEMTSIYCDNQTSNVIPNKATAQFNIRFNPLHTPDSLITHVEKVRQKVLQKYSVQFSTFLENSCNALPFLTQDATVAALLQRAIMETTGITPVMSTTGGTSDARFIHKFCPVIELGGLSGTIHKYNEFIAVEDLKILEKIYAKVLALFFAEA